MGREAAMLLIVTDDDRLLLHLRDDRPGILHPGCWAGFGGALEDGESTLDALHREVRDEIGLEVRDPEFLAEVVDVEGAGDEVSLFFVQGGIGPEDIDLKEGAGIGVHAFEDLAALDVTPFVRRAIAEHLAPRLGWVTDPAVREHDMDLAIGVEDPRAEEALTLLVGHLAFAQDHSPPDHVHAFDVDAFLDPDVTLFGARRAGVLVGVGAIRQLDRAHAELTSMHVAAAARGRGVGRALLDHLLAVAADRGYQRVSLETGSMAAFEPARALYRGVGFEVCEPFAHHTANDYSICMTLCLA